MRLPPAGKTADGSYIRFNAAKGVILATGDYQNNEAMVDRYVADAQPFNRKQINKTGDGHLIGLLAGAVMEPGCHAKMIHGGAGCFREEPFLAVNINGERFMYEDVAYGARNTILRDQPEHRMITIFDANYSDQVYGWGSDPTVPTVANGTPEKIAGFVEKGVLLAADTLEELAEQIGVPADALVATVNRYNELCALGTDLDFGKASRYMQPIETAPFYGMPREYAIASPLAWSSTPMGSALTPTASRFGASSQRAIAPAPSTAPPTTRCRPWACRSDAASPSAI